jgi:hypothetical protein
MADLEVLWQLFVASALRYPWVRMLDGATAAALWIPPGGTELTAREESELEPLLRRLVGERASAEGMPAYLESSNPANDARYERIGFRKIGAFATPDGAHTVATMWREPQDG